MREGVSLLIGALVVTCVVSGCIPPKFADISVKSDVDIDKFTGITWYQTRAAPWTGSDVAERFYKEGDKFMVVEAGRLPGDKKCRKYIYVVDGDAGRYTAVDASDPTFTGQFLLLDTDYLTYFAGLSCFHVNGDGVCDKYLASAYSSFPSRMLSGEAKRKVTDIFDRLCINKFEIAGTTGNECLRWNLTT